MAGCDPRRLRGVGIPAIREPDGRFALDPDAQHVVHPGETPILIGPARGVYELGAMHSRE